MSFWDNVKKFAQPYADDEYDEYEDDEYMDDYDEPEQPARRQSRRQAAPAPAPVAPVNQNPGAPFGLCSSGCLQRPDGSQCGDGMLVDHLLLAL